VETASYEIKREIQAYVIMGRECRRSVDQVAIGSVKLTVPRLIERIGVGGKTQICSDSLSLQYLVAADIINAVPRM
jgi:hypothetical protein